MSILELPAISRIRRNHGLEHATLTILSDMKPSLRLSGISHTGGFLILGDVETEDLKDAIHQALVRMSNGEHRLAVHPNCGTNMATSGILAGILAWLGFAGTRNGKDKLNRLPVVITLVTLSLIFSRSLGPLVQERITTSGNPEGLQLVDIVPFKAGSNLIHRVTTSG